MTDKARVDVGADNMTTDRKAGHTEDSVAEREIERRANRFPWRNPKFREAELIARWKWLKSEKAKRAKAKGDA